MRSLLKPLALPYGAAAALKNFLYDSGWLQPEALRNPVISVGNLSTGGAGKTPVVIALAQLLQTAGRDVDVLSRGYGRRSRATMRVLPEGSADEFGDEPLLIARATGAPVYVARTRVLAGRLAEGAGDRRLHLLDDGFQHRRLRREFDVVVMHPSDIRNVLLPSGALREPLRSLQRADALVLRDGDTETEGALRRLGLCKPAWRVRRSMEKPPVSQVAVAFCGIAHPGEFFQNLREQGVELVATFAFRDHHRWEDRDLEAIAKKAATCGASLLTTEKDWVRLSSSQRRWLQDRGLVWPVPLRVTFLDPESVLEQVLRRAPSAAGA